MKNIKKLATGITAATLMATMMSFTGCTKISGKVVTEEKDFDVAFENVEIDASMENVKILKSEDDECHVIFAHSESFDTKIEVEGNTLVVTENGKFNVGGVSFSDDEIYLEVYLPEDSYKNLDIDVASSDIESVSGIDFEVIDIDTASGDIHLKDMNSDSVEIDTASGNVNLANVIADSVDINTASGDVFFDMSDADKISVDSASGDITGTLLSGKTFDVDTASGDVSVPGNSDGGTCEINTASGDVDLDVA